jgi:hypothetical protein
LKEAKSLNITLMDDVTNQIHSKRQLQDAVSPAFAIDPTPLPSNIVRYCLSEDQVAGFVSDD